MSRKTFKSKRIRHRREGREVTYLNEDGSVIPLASSPDKARNEKGELTVDYQTWYELRKEVIKQATYMADVPCSIKFSQLDCKDFGPVYLAETENSYGASEQPKNNLILEIAEVDYLQRLKALQVEMDEKYGPMLEPEGSTVEPDEDLKALAKTTNLANGLRLDLYYH